MIYVLGKLNSTSPTKLPPLWFTEHLLLSWEPFGWVSIDKEFISEPFPFTCEHVWGGYIDRMGHFIARGPACSVPGSDLGSWVFPAPSMATDTYVSVNSMNRIKNLIYKSGDKRCRSML